MGSARAGRLFFVLAFLWVQSLFAASPEISPYRITSYAGNFVVISSDLAAASWSAREAERARERVLKEFQWKQRWKLPVVLRIEFALPKESSNASATVFQDQSDGRKKILNVVLREIFPAPPYWLQCGLERFFSGRGGFSPDDLKEVQAAGMWLDLSMLLKRQSPLTDAGWRQIYERETAGLIAFLQRKHPAMLLAFRRGRGNTQAMLVLEDDWLQWIQSVSTVLMIDLQDFGKPSPDSLCRALNRCLRVRLRDEAGKVLDVDSVLALPAVLPCCKKDIARRRLLECYPELLRLSRFDDKNISQVSQYLDCANRILSGKEFFETFTDLETRRRMPDSPEHRGVDENTAYQR